MNAGFDLLIAYVLDQDTRCRDHCGDPEAARYRRRDRFSGASGAKGD